MRSVNPATGEELANYEDHDGDDVDAALGAATNAFESWADRNVEERCDLLDDAADVLREKTETYAELMTEEMGKPIDQARSEVEKCAWVCEYYAEHAPEQLQTERMASDAGERAEVRYEPLGPVLAVMPWNFPFWQVFRFAAPNLAAGNVGLLKHASNVPGCALAIEEVFEEAGFPEDAFQSLLIGSDLVEDVIRDDRVVAATLTGSERAGRSVGETAGNELKKTVLELGGSDPFVVLDDADVQQAAETGAWARVQNSGQSCIAAKRFIVHADVYDEFVDAFVDEMDDFEVGDPKDADTDVGPQAREDLLEDMHEQVRQSVEDGATVQTGGEPLDWDGPYYPPTVLTDVPRDSRAATEEVFGPAAAVFRARDEDHAVEIANDTKYGLGANLWTEDRERADRLADELRAGSVFVNSYVGSDPRLPFGGIKASGYGRELSEHGIREFVNRKTVHVE
ncbi:NAD-dependent succinate-semialdehyde dehydrogenase [Halobacterium zhouii]|uniref:NAD-dependent succinate-semialdehyde dehydrogenase n=1 Tax=Halobacterium zhouii TaxID=2902624 RepID=UPI001E55F448|nr:NAD-dependent succinate-semialdehyde dehydrogenase [Halobacterium zhouii]